MDSTHHQVFAVDSHGRLAHKLNLSGGGGAQSNWFFCRALGLESDHLILPFAIRYDEHISRLQTIREPADVRSRGNFMFGGVSLDEKNGGEQRRKNREERGAWQRWGVRRFLYPRRGFLSIV